MRDPRGTATVERPPTTAPTLRSTRRAREWRRLRWPRPAAARGAALALVSFWLGLLWAGAIRPLNAPDETAYLQAVMQTRRERSLPEIHFDFTQNPAGEVVGGPGDAATREYIAAAGFSDRIRLLAYQNVQPPLYFLIAGLVSQPFPLDPAIVLYVSRVVSAAFGAGMVFFCWAATRQLAPQAPLWAVAVAGVVALLPEFCFNNARAGNDSLANCLGAATFYLWFRGLRDPTFDRRLLWAGAVVGLAVLAKLTALILLPGLALVVLFRTFQGRRGERWTTLATRGLRLALGAGGSLLLVCGWWFVRNMIVYGEPSGTGAANVFWRLNLPGLNWNDPTARWDFVQATWLSFWGYFGWQDISLPAEFYNQAFWLSLLLVALSVGAGLVLLARRLFLRLPLPAYAWQTTVIMAVTVVGLLFSFVQFSLTVALQAQGRYLYLALLPAALLFTGGLHALMPGRALKTLALSIPLLWLAVMNAAGLALVVRR